MRSSFNQSDENLKLDNETIAVRELVKNVCVSESIYKCNILERISLGFKFPN